MSIADYAHWNEEARTMWWAEEGRFEDEPPEDYEDGYPYGDEDDYDEWLDEGLRDEAAEEDDDGS